MSGYVVVNGRCFPVTEMRLAGGKMCLTCAVQGPVPTFEGGAVTVFGADGIGVCQGDSLVTWPDVRPEDTLVVHISMAWDSCYGDAEEAG